MVCGVHTCIDLCRISVKPWSTVITLIGPGADSGYVMMGFKQATALIMCQNQENARKEK